MTKLILSLTALLSLTACASLDTSVDPSQPKVATQLEYRTGSLIPVKKAARPSDDVKTVSGEDMAATIGRAGTATDPLGKK